MRKLVPFLKWAGGKRWLTSAYPELLQTAAGRHIEPFCGSAAVFFHLQPKSAILADLNPRLIECYQVIRDEPAWFLDLFSELANLHSHEQYYEIRAKSFDTAAERAAQFVYLNRVCFNGIYRENLAGIFNVPIGSKSKAMLDTDDFTAVSLALKGTTLLSSDFEPIVDQAVSGDFLFVDPPYTAKHNNNGFVKYNQSIFSWSDQERLARCVCRAAKRGAKVLVTNADHHEVRQLYQSDFKVSSLSRASVIGSLSSSRGVTSEMVATNV